MILGSLKNRRSITTLVADKIGSLSEADIEILAHKAAAGGYASLDGMTKVPIAQIPQGSIVIAESQVTNLPADLAAIASSLSSQATAIALRELLSNKGIAGGYPSLDGSIKVPIDQIPLGTTSSTVVVGNDARLSDARTPTTHKTTHQDGGSDEINVNGLNGVLADPQPPIIGSGAAQAVAGNDVRLTDSRAPSGAAAGSLGGTFPNPTVESLDGAMAQVMTRVLIGS